MKTIRKIFENSIVRLYFIGVAVNITTDMMSKKLVNTIPSLNRHILDLLKQTVTHHLPDTELWNTLLNIASWILATLIFTLILLFAFAAFKKLTNIFKPSSIEPPPYEGYTGRFCFKSGVYQARINPDYHVEVMSGNLFPHAITIRNELMPTAWDLIRTIKDNSSLSSSES